MRKAVCAELVRLLSDERKRQKMSMNVLAAKSGLSQSFISMFESLPANPTVDTLLRISAVLGLDAGEVLKQALGNLAASSQAKTPRRRRVKPRA